jgi:hypothetical protein
MELQWKIESLETSIQKGVQASVQNLQAITLAIMKDIKKHLLGMILRPIVMIGIWIVVIYGMTTTSIFYLMTLLHLM